MRLVPETYGVCFDQMAQELQELLNTEAISFPDVSGDDGGDDFPTLHDLFDVQVDNSEEDSNEDAVNLIFPDSLLLAAEEGIDVGPDSGSLPQSSLVSEELDLRCYEDGVPASDSEADDDVPEGKNEKTVSGTVEIDGKEVNFVLDCPPHPGHDCRACTFHRTTSGNSDAICALCYMRLNGSFIYSK